jgi:hypothetical protein
MKGQRIWSEAEGGSDRARRHSLGAGLHEQPEYVEPIILSESGQGRDDIRLFHISTNMEMTRRRQVIFQRLLKCSWVGFWHV